LTDQAQKFFVTGEASPLINTLLQYGVSIKDANGNLRDQGQIFEELADKTAVYGREYQNFALKQAGLSQGEINYLALSRQERGALLALAERNNDVTDASVRKAAELQMYWRNIGLQIMAAGQTLLTAVTPVIEQILKVFGDVNAQSEEFTTGLKLIGSAAVVIKNIFVGVGDAVGGAAAAIAAALHGDFAGAAEILKDQSARTKARNQKEADDLVFGIWGGQTAAQSAATIDNAANPDTAGDYRPPPSSRAAQFNNPGNILDSQGRERRYATYAEGEAALENDLAIKMRRGLRTVDAIIDAYEGHDTVRNNIPAYIADVQKRLGKNELSEADIKALARAIAIHESGAYSPTPGAYSGQIQRSGNTTSNSTNVSIGTMQINAPNADPNAVADKVPAAIQRKISVTQADTGVT
jgi:hypothetical protein